MKITFCLLTLTDPWLLNSTIFVYDSQYYSVYACYENFIFRAKENHMHCWSLMQLKWFPSLRLYSE